MKKNKKDLFKLLPSVDELLQNKKIQDLQKAMPRSVVTDSIREAVDYFRKEIVGLGEDLVDSFELGMDKVVDKVMSTVEKNAEKSLVNVINATGIVLHTNLGRSLLSEKIHENLWNLSSRYTNLEYDIKNGKRGSRYVHLTDIIKKLTGAEDVLVVNNNAAAVLLILSTMAKGREAIVSRGELVEVGGAFRIPSIMSLSGTNLVEVGATNKTHYADYEDAITEDTAVLMKVHTSNYRVVGFSESVSLEDMRKMGDKYSIPVIEDLGSGVFVDFSKYGLKYEPTVKDSINAGVDIVSFSGDKMLGGPQAGIIVGKKKYIEQMKKNQLTRALRVDKLTIAALEETLSLYLDEEKAVKEIPTLRMLTYTKEELTEKAENLHKKIVEIISRDNLEKIDLRLEDCSGLVGGGSMPTEELLSKSVSIRLKSDNHDISTLEESLRLSPSHIIARVYDGKYVLDVRTIFEEQNEIIAKELEKALSKLD